MYMFIHGGVRVAKWKHLSIWRELVGRAPASHTLEHSSAIEKGGGNSMLCYVLVPRLMVSRGKK